MKTSVRPRLLNGQTGDPALLITLRWQGRSLLIDLGRIDRTPAAVLYGIEAVFVSHAHMDHFMGFDQLLRLFLARDTTLRLYGPEGIADCVAGKLRRRGTPDGAPEGAGCPGATSRAARKSTLIGHYDGTEAAFTVYSIWCDC